MSLPQLKISPPEWVLRNTVTSYLEPSIVIRQRLSEAGTVTGGVDLIVEVIVIWGVGVENFVGKSDKNAKINRLSREMVNNIFKRFILD